MTAEQLAEAKRYNRLGLACSLADRAIDVAYLLVAALLLARPIDEWLKTSPWLEHDRWLRLGAMFVLVTALHACVSFPLSLYSGHVLEHRFGLSRLSLLGWLWRYTKRMSLVFGLGLAMVEGLYLVIWLTGPYWWLAGAGAAFLVGIVVGQLAPVLLLPLFYKVERLENNDLAERFGRVAQGTGLSVEGVYRLKLSAETVKANAMLAGLGRTRRVILADTLLDHFSQDEISVVFAHEIGHHVHRHLWKILIVGLVFSIAGFYLGDRLMSDWVQGIQGSVQYDALPVYTLPMLMLIITVFQMVLEPLANTISRHFERQADRFALQRTGLPDAFRTAFMRLARQNKADPDPHPLEVFLFDSHPPIAARLALADEYAMEAKP